MGDYFLQVDLVNEDENVIFSRFTEPVDDVVWFKANESPDNLGDIYRAAQREFGRCTSSIYVDQKTGPAKKVGWYFVSRQKFEDTGQPYLRGAWVRVVNVVPEQRLPVELP